MPKHWATCRPRNWSTSFLTRYQRWWPRQYADTLTCVEAGAQVKTEADTDAGVKAYTVVDTLNEVEAEALVYTQAYTFPQVKANSTTDTLSDMEAETPVDTLTDASRSDCRDTGRHIGQCRSRGIA